MAVGHTRTLVLAGAGVVLLAVQHVLRQRRKRPRGVFLVPGLPVLGSTVDILRHIAARTQLDFFANLTIGHGRTIGVKMLMQPWWVVTTKPENVQHVLSTNFANYQKGVWFRDRLEDLLGHGIFNVDGQQWFHQRKTTSRMFTANFFKDHLWVVAQKNVQKLKAILHEVASSNSEEPIDMFDLINRYTLDTIGETGFGKNIGSMENPSSPFLKSFDHAQRTCYYRFFVPGWWLLKATGLFTESETKKHFGRLDDYSRETVRELCGAIRGSAAEGSGDVRSRSFVGLFIEDAKKTGAELSEDYLRDLVLNFLIAGRDTTAQAITWCFYCLSTHPEVEARAREEVLKVCGTQGPQYEDLNRLPYVQAVLHEALRLYPSVPMEGKVSVADDTWPDGTFLPAGTSVVLCVYGIGRDPAVWGPDAEEFRPERWLEMDSVPTNYVYPVFNAGPRECLGRRLAQVEMKACLATLLPHFSLKLAVPPEAVQYDGQLTLGMRRGLPCRVLKVPQAEEGECLSNVETAVPSELEEPGTAA